MARSLKQRAANLARQTGAVVGRVAGAALTVGPAVVGGMVGTLAASVMKGYQGRWAVGGAYHDAARIDDTNRDWRAHLASADQTILDELDTMVARSRHLIANDGYAASAQGAWRRKVVGGGITARSAARNPDTGEMLLEYNAALDTAWDAWAWEPTLCDAEDTKSLYEKQAVWMNELFAAGGVFLKINYVPSPLGVGLMIQEIEYEQADETILEFQGRPVRRGIEIGDRGQPVAYHLFTTGHPLENPGLKSTRVLAGEIVHLFRQDRVRQHSGAPWMRPVLMRLRNLAMYDRYTMIQARTRAAFAGVVTKTAATPTALGTPAVIAKMMGAAASPAVVAEDDPTEIKINIWPGILPVLPVGADFKTPANNTPDSMYPPFVAEQLRGISAATGLDLPTVQRWYADGNFNTQRKADNEVQAETDAVQDLLFVQKALRRIRREFVRIAALENHVAAPGLWKNPRWTEAYLKTNWQGPPRIPIDEIKAAAARKMNMGMLQASPQDFFNEQGKDPRQVVSEIAEFIEMCVTDYKLPRDLVIQCLLGQSSGKPGQPRAGMMPDDPSVDTTDGRRGSGGGDNGGFSPDDQLTG